MKTSYILLCIGVMASVTYIIRMLPLTFFKKKIENPFINSFFAYVPYAVLGAMTFPDILYSTGSMVSAILGFITAIYLSLKEKSMIIVSLAAVFVVFITERLLSL